MNKYIPFVTSLVSMSLLLNPSFAESSFQPVSSEIPNQTFERETPTDQELVLETETTPERHKHSKLWMEEQIR